MFIYENQQEFDNQGNVMEWVQDQLTNYCFLYQKPEGDDMNVSHNLNLNLVLILFTKKWWGLFCSGSIIGTFAAHLKGQEEFQNSKSSQKGLLTIIPTVLLHSLQLE